jgi:3-(3-hydroxy-phenyl)propionate hydroxylase
VLSSYQEERFPHALASVRMSEQLGRLVMTTRPGLAQARDAAVSRALATPAGRKYFGEMRYRPPQRYTDGLVLPHKDFPTGAVIGQPLVFDTGRHQVSRLDEVLGAGWALLGVGIAESCWDAVEPISTALAAPTLEVSVDDYLPRTSRRLLLDVDGGLIREFGDYSGTFVLLRPDRIVAAAWRPSEDDVVDRVLAWTPRSLTVSPERALTHG